MLRKMNSRTSSLNKFMHFFSYLIVSILSHSRYSTEYQLNHSFCLVRGFRNFVTKAESKYCGVRVLGENRKTDGCMLTRLTGHNDENRYRKRYSAMFLL